MRGSSTAILLSLVAALLGRADSPRFAPPRHAASRDVLILRDGKTVRGDIPVCDPDLCRLGSKSYTRAEMAWIGLSPSDSKPPAVSGVAEDEVHLTDGSVHTGHLVGLSLGLVDIEGGSWDRSDVSWIHLAGAPAAPTGAIGGQEATGGGNRAPTPSPTPTPLPSPSPQPQPQPQPQPPPPTPPGSGKKAHLWSGEIHVHFRLTNEGTSTDEKTDIAAHLREYRYALLRPTDGKAYGTLIHLLPEGTEIHSKYVTDVTGEWAGVHCDGQGTVTKTSDPGASSDQGSTIWISNTTADPTPWIGFPIVRGTPLYVVAFSSPREKYPVDCLAWRINAGKREEFPSTQDEAYYLAGFGRSPLGCPAFLRTVCDPQIRTIEGENGRMFGSFRNTWEENDFHHDLVVRWSLCRDDVPCAAAPPEPDQKPCGGSAVQEANLQRCLDSEDAILGQMKEKWEGYQRYQGKASPHQSDFMKAIGACAGWDAAELAIEALLITEVPSVGLSADEAVEVKEFKESLELINRLMKSATTGDPLQAFKSGDVSQLLTALEAVKKFFETFPVLDHGEPEQFLEHLDECNAPLSADLRASAQTFLLETQHAMEELHDYRELSNDLRSKENECLNEQIKAYNACMEDAQCHGTPESACDRLKPKGNW